MPATIRAEVMRMGALMVRFLFICIFLIGASIAAKGAVAADQIREFNRQVEQFLMASDFEALDSMAGDFRKTDARFLGSHSKLYHLYYALAGFKPQSRDCGCSDPSERFTFEDKEHALKTWLVQRPQSITARLALARLFIGFAWDGRGHAYANAVTEEQWKLFRDRLNAALAYLEGVSPEDDPNVYLEYAEIARDLGSRSELDKIYAAETRDYPTFFHFYAERAGVLQEKWAGRPGELARYARSLLSSPGGEAGEIAYTYVAGRLVTKFSPERLFEETGLDWPTLKQAYLVRKRRYGWSDSEKRILLSYAIAAHDDAFAADLRAHWNE